MHDHLVKRGPKKKRFARASARPAHAAFTLDSVPVAVDVGDVDSTVHAAPKDPHVQQLGQGLRLVRLAQHVRGPPSKATQNLAPLRRQLEPTKSLEELDAGMFFLHLIGSLLRCHLQRGLELQGMEESLIARAWAALEGRLRRVGHEVHEGPRRDHSVGVLQPIRDPPVDVSLVDALAHLTAYEVLDEALLRAVSRLGK